MRHQTLNLRVLYYLDSSEERILLVGRNAAEIEAPDLLALIAVLEDDRVAGVQGRACREDLLMPGSCEIENAHVGPIFSTRSRPGASLRLQEGRYQQQDMG